MKRHLLHASVIAMTLALASSAAADDSHAAAPTADHAAPTKAASPAPAHAAAAPAKDAAAGSATKSAADAPAPMKDSPLAREIAAALSMPAPAVPTPVAAPTPPKAPVVTAPTMAASTAARTATPPPAPPPAPVAVAAPAAPPPAPAPPAPAPAAAHPAEAAHADKAPGSEPAPNAESALGLRPTKPLVLAQTSTSTPWPYKLGFGAVIAAAGYMVWKKRRAAASAPGAAAKKKQTAVRVVGKTSMGLRGELAVVEVGGMRLLVGVTPSSMQTLAVLADGDAADLTTEESEPARAAPSLPPLAPARETPRGSRAPMGPRSLSNRPSELASRARSLFSSADLGPPVPARVSGAPFAASRYADESDIESVEDETIEHERESRAPRDSGAPRDSRGPRDESEPRRRSSRAPEPVEGQARGLALAMGNRR